MHDDLRWMARFAGAAVLTTDASIVDEFLVWLGGLLDDEVAAEVITVSAHAVAKTIQPFAPTGARLLRAATDRLYGATPI